MLEVITSNTDISLVFSQGKRANCPTISLIAMKCRDRHGHTGRVAFIAGKKHGSAVWRNRAKRRMRAIARELGAPWPGYDVVFIAKTATTEQRYSKVLQQTKKMAEELLKDCNV